MNNSLVGFPIVCVKACLPTINCWHAVPQLAGALAAAVTYIESDDLPGLYVYRNPDPLFVLLATYKTPHFVGFRLQPQEMDGAIQVCGQLQMEVIRQLVVEFSYEAQQPAQAHGHYPADAERREAFEEQSLNHCTVLFGNALRGGNELSPAIEALMVLFSIVSVTI
jgi:hypothetical protein